MRRPLAFGAVALALAAAGGCDDGDDAADGPPAAGYPRATREVTLSPSQRRTARTIMRADRRLRRALDGNPLRIAQMGPWLTSDHRFVGASAVVPLRSERSYPMRDWPLMNGDPGGGVAYAVKETPMRLTAVSELLVEVDLKRRRLVGINPGGEHARVEYGPGVELEEPTGY